MTTETAGSRVPFFATVLICFLLVSVRFPPCGGEMAAQFGGRCNPVARSASVKVDPFSLMLLRRRPGQRNLTPPQSARIDNGVTLVAAQGFRELGWVADVAGY